MEDNFRNKKKLAMAPSKSLDIRWIRRYRIFFILGSIILSIQVFLAYKFFPIDAESIENAQEHRGLSGKGKINIENLNEDINGGVSSRRYKENYMVVDDEDSPSNSNSVNGVYNKVKVPPDKTETNIRQHFIKGKTVVSKLYNRTSILRLEELDFVPACEISTKEAISAIHRAKTQLCKQQLANITCLSQEGLLYPTHLPSSCPAPGFSAGKSLGCYRDEKTFRLLSGYYANLKNTNSPQNCINMCLQSGFSYAGVQYSTECFCGADEPPSTSRLPDSSCNMKCPADPKQACGGFFTINVYQTGIAKFTPQVPKEISENSSETPIRIAFLLTLNGRALRQVKRLIKILFHTDHYFYIHVDARQDYLYRELLSLETILPNLRLARHRYSTIWGGASLLQMLLKSMNELLNSDWKWDFVINLSESDFPVKTNDQLVNFLSANKGKNFVKSHGREVQRFIQKQGLDKTFVECDAHMWRAGDRALPCGLQIDGGSDWVALSRPFVEYVASGSEKNDPLLVGLEAVFRHTLLPAESFFHTALRNSQFCRSYVDNNLHVTNWKRRLGCKCQYKHVVDWCGCSPNDFKTEDWPRIQGTSSRQLFFARKFEPIINQAIIDQVEEWLYGVYPPNIPNLHAYWQNIYHSADLSPPADDSLLTIATSKARIVTKSLSECKINSLQILEVTSYLFNDNYKGSLILYEGSFKGQNNTFRFETWIKPNFHFTIVKDFGPVGRLKQFFVSSDFDQKEQISRNLLMTLGPFSEPAIVFHFTAGTSTYNVSFLWVDPIGQIVDISEFHIEEGNVINHVKSSLRDPLLPGIWTVNMIYNSTIVAQTQFLITPLQFVSGAQVSQQQAGFLHSNSVGLSSFQEALEYEKLLNISIDKKNALHRKMIANARRFGPDLNEWIDHLTTKFYKIIDTCILLFEQFDMKCFKSRQIPACHTTLWSSLGLDPKSLIKKANFTSGRMDRW